MEHTEKGSGDAREGKHGLRPAVSIDRTLVFHKTDRRHFKKERHLYPYVIIVTNITNIMI